ncbi:MAG: ABC-type nitrate/sulfonate/bicarbonate transport system, periplasmic component [Deltaproteobacteria bacterium]|jgi:ABC-type nitrate/sulfonate/bicarbonate transport system substrate-binding protein|nr:ABC-type nitrate/sulfonate/bicarbonate transport system, periplasmic component [Deltaproteobacteria bacterium]
MKRKLLITISLLFISAKLTSAAELQVITVALVSPSWSTGLPTAVARGAGFFRNEGLEVRPVTLASSGPIMMALLMSGQAEMVIAGGVAILRGIARGAPVVVVGGHLSRMSYALIGAKGLKTVDDLKGKAIGITGIGGIGEFAVVESLKRNGLIKDRDFTLLNIEGGTAARMAALKAGKVHAVPVTPGQRVQAENDGFTILLDVRDSLADLPSNIVASTKEFAKSNPDKTIRFLRALGRAVDLIQQDKDKAIALGKANGLRGDAPMERKALDYYVQDLDIRINKNNVEALLKLLDIADPPERFFDDTYLSRALAR